MFTTALQPDCSAVTSIPQHVASVAHEPVAPPLLLPELELVLPLLLPEPLLELVLHSLWQLDVTHMPVFEYAVEQADSISLATHDELVAALAEYVPPGHAQET